VKRFHVHVGVADLDASVRFYSALFGAEPSVRKNDYAKWMLDDPRINFAISHRGGAVGINHLGLQVDAPEELEALHAQLTAADRSIVAERDAACCYARSDKYWVTDPAGVAWESFHTLASIPVFGGTDDGADACCSQSRDDDAVELARVRAASCCGSATDAVRRDALARTGCCT